MTARRCSPGAYRLPEWGQESGEPGSQVRDAQGRMVFTGSPVRMVAGSAGRVGTVVALLSPGQVLVRWAGAAEPVSVPAAELVTMAVLRNGEWVAP
jgi:hypothetical protein